MSLHTTDLPTTAAGEDRTSAAYDDDLLWPPYDTGADLAAIEAVPLEDRGLPASTYEALRRAAEQWPDKPAVTSMPDAARWREATTRTYAQLHGDVVAVANLLRSLGVERGDAVALLSPNSDELITATLAAQLAGIAAPINPLLAADHVTELLARSGARVVVCAGPELHPATYAMVEQVAAAGSVEDVLLLAPTGASVPEESPSIPGVRVQRLGAASAGHDRTAFSGRPPAADDLAGLFHTGGTTGVPKLAAHTHRNEVADAWALAANNILDDDSVVFAGLPLFHVNALVVTLLAPLMRGRSTVWAGPAGYRDPAFYSEFWRMIEHFRLATMSGVPTVYAVLAAFPVDADISTMRTAMVGASPLPPGVRAAFEQATGVRLLEGYGLTEATCATVRSFPDDHRDGMLGQRMPYQQVKAIRVEDDGTWTDLPAGETGVLAISGPTVFAGYVQGRDAEGGLILDGLGKLRDGWLDTGDLGMVDADGWVRLAGRAKDLIIRGGHNIDPILIEDALLEHPAVTGAGAVGQPDAHSGEVPVAYVTLTPDADVDEAALQAWAREHISESAAAPKHVRIVPALPITDVGKPNKLPLRADAARREVEAALVSVPGVAAVEAGTVNGSTRVTVQVTAEIDEARLGEVMGAYALDWTAEPATGPAADGATEAVEA